MRGEMLHDAQPFRSALSARMLWRRYKMVARKRYEPCCPAIGCRADASYLGKVSAGSVKVPREILATKGPGDVIYLCGYCKLVWFQPRDAPPGFNPTLKGYYGDLQNRGKFLPLRGRVRIHRENTPEYWDQVSERRRRPRGER